MDLPKRIKSWQFHEFGHIRNLRLESVPMPVLAEGEALVKVDYAGLNPADKFLIMGRYPGAGKPPFSVGRDGCGTIVVSGPKKRFEVGQRVVCLKGIIGIEKDGTLAQYVTVPEAHLGEFPSWWSLQEGAAGPLVLLTAWQAYMQANIKPGKKVVITGASGGVGLAGLALAKAQGLKTIALSRSATKRAKLLELGADFVLDIEDPEIVSKIKDLGGADIILENVCGQFLNKSVDIANEYGRIYIIGALGGIDCRIDPINVIFKRLTITGIQNSLYTDAEAHQAWDDILRLLEPVQGKVPIDTIFPFLEVQEAFEHLRKGPLGKVVVGPMH